MHVSSPRWARERIADVVDLHWIPKEGGHYNNLRSALVPPPSGSHLNDATPASVQRILSTRMGLGSRQRQIVATSIGSWIIGARTRFQGLFDEIEQITVVVTTPDESQEWLKMLGISSSQGEAWTVSNEAYSCFLVVIPCPQELRRKEEELDWLQAATVHELEHVVQMGVTKTPLVGKWLQFSEACAVWREMARAGESRVSLDYGFAYLTGFPQGLEGGASDRGYRWFPFIEHVESQFEDSIDEVWRSLATSVVEDGPLSGPLTLLGSILGNQGSSLGETWEQFCLEAPFPQMARIKSPSMIQERFGELCVSMDIDFNRLPNEFGSLGVVRESTPNSYEARIDLAYLSCHYLLVTASYSNAWSIEAWRDYSTNASPAQSIAMKAIEIGTEPNSEYHWLDSLRTASSVEISIPQSSQRGPQRRFLVAIINKLIAPDALWVADGSIVRDSDLRIRFATVT